MNSSTFAGNSDGLVTGLCPAPPPPPPPPPIPGQVPAMRISTVEAPAVKRPQIPNNDGYEPPAAIQNAMLTKDKKPFTYTPGMGGKLDLSQIRSPRMARRVAKNANDEGIEGPPKSALEPKPTPAQNTPNVFVQPQVAVPVFPTNIPPQPSNRTPPTPPTPPVNKFASNGNVVEKAPEPVKTVIKVEPRTPVSPVQPSTPESPSTPTQVTLAKAPTPWMQNKMKKTEEELPEWAKRNSGNKQSPSPESISSPPVYPQAQQVQPQWQQVQQKQQPRQQLNQQPQQYQTVQQQPQQFNQPQQYNQAQQFNQPQQYIQQPQQFSQQPQQFNQQPQQFNQQPQQKRQFTSPNVTQQTSPQTQERVIPIRIEDRPSVFDVKHEAGHHQFKQPPSPHHQQRWGQPPVQNQVQAQQAQQSTGGGYIIPIMVEGSDKRSASGPGSNTSYSQQAGRNSTLENQNQNQTVKVIQQRGPTPAQQVEPGPVQSRSFRVLQKITDTDSPNDVDTDQLRKLQLTEDDRVLMNKFKEQVDSDSYLHHEEDPRYRGAAIPSRAFRFLQTMTDGGEVPVAATGPRMQNSAINKKQNRNSKSFEESQANLPPSEQQVPEPKKYMGSAIPSRSFRILQAMTAPESVATQENRQADYTCQTENNMPGNQQGVFYPPPPPPPPPPCPPPYWNSEGPYWAYYPLPFPGAPNDPKNPYESYPYHQDGTAYIYYPIYNQNYPSYPPYNPPNVDKNVFTPLYTQYVVPTTLHNSQNGFEQLNPCDQPTQDSGMNIEDNRLQDCTGKIPNGTNNLNLVPQWDKNDNISRTASTNSNKDSDCTTAMNITDEEEIPETIVMDRGSEALQQNGDDVDGSSAGLNINVPNYTYIDTSDSSESTDSESHSDNESVIESSKSCSSSNNNAECDNTSSDSDDSDSYLAYSTGLNPHGRCTDYEKDTANKYSTKGSSEDLKQLDTNLEKVNAANCQLNFEGEEKQEVERSKTDSSFPHKLSVIYEDTEQIDSENSKTQKCRDTRNWNDTPFEATDDPPDDVDSTTVSVSLPLRFKFSVSENNEDVTTVIVGDSLIKEERPTHSKAENRIPKLQISEENKTSNEVSSSFQVDSETTVDFTVRRHSSEVKKKIRDFEKVKEGQSGQKAEKSEEDATPHVNFTLRKIPTRLNKINCEETIETEYTIKSKKISTRKEELKLEKENVSTATCLKAKENIVINTTKEKCTTESTNIVSDSLANNINNIAVTKSDQNKLEVHDFNKNVVKPEVVVSECVWGEEAKKSLSEDSSSSNTQSEIEKKVDNKNKCDLLTKQKFLDDRNIDIEEKSGKEPKHLLSVQNSREETDDEDSGVTSDMSRIISEVDTDSECTSSRNIRKYQRTQTHSRLFRLLNDDSIISQPSQKTNDPSSRREYLSLPLKSNNFNYDENYCSNYSSGLTSPEYSPICEQSWKRLHDSENTLSTQNGVESNNNESPSSQDRPQEDPYYQAWKTSKSTGNSDQDVLPSLAFKILENRRPFWPYKVNVLCPRIKSTKSVPQILQSKSSDTTVPPIPQSYVNLKSDHC